MNHARTLEELSGADVQFAQQCSAGGSSDFGAGLSLPPPPSKKTKTAHSAQALTSIQLNFDSPFDATALKVYLDFVLFSEKNVETKAGTGLSAASTLSMSNAALSHPAWSPHSALGLGREIYRLKGILCLAGETHMHILQGVHDTFELQESSFPVPEPGAIDADVALSKSRIIAIGCGLDENALHQGFSKCLALP